ncbi:NADH dehydrogenase [ubiquinone] 1 alpha subcomplex subunit 11-like [Lineus longissimus]|uniref:NADH dehydrogenase [ubiquinone] 1 alpha subcomplex subunit 11-like n=1 Tax=Lineus longissimus TaxID=88925 RepID=UPI002B4D0CC4
MAENDDKKTVLAYDKLYETPDGTDCIGKMLRATAMTSYIGMVWSGIDIIGLSKPATVMAGVVRAGSFIIPAAAIGATYSAATCISGKITGVDDGINHFFGGCAAGVIIGARTKKIGYGIGFGLAFGIAGFMAKKAYVEDVGIVLRPGDRKHYPDQGGFFHYSNSYDPWRKEVKRT